MPFCTNCGAKINDKEKFCSECGSAVQYNNNADREVQYAGKIIKCPNCGETLHAFALICPTCGMELRSTRPSSAVKEFASKIESVQQRRNCKQRFNIFSIYKNQMVISEVDQELISLIQSFPVPNNREDILEFMILATSNVNIRTYDPFRSGQYSKGEVGINDAWVSKIEQVYEKAKQAYGNDKEFYQIETLYRKYIKKTKKQKRSGVLKVVGLLFACFAIPIIILTSLAIAAPIAARNETARLEEIESAALTALEEGEYKKALLNAELLEYSPSVDRSDTERISKQWDIKRELLIDRILSEAEQNGIYLERTVDVQDSSESASDNS